MTLHRINFTRLKGQLVISASAIACTGGCSADFGREAETRAPERLRGVNVSYDVAGLGAQDAARAPEPVQSPYVPIEPTKMLVWWQTADGVVHQKEIVARGGTISPEKFAGSLWVEVTAIGSRPKRLETMPSTTPSP